MPFARIFYCCLKLLVKLGNSFKSCLCKGCLISFGSWILWERLYIQLIASWDACKKVLLLGVAWASLSAYYQSLVTTWKGNLKGNKRVQAVLKMTRHIFKAMTRCLHIWVRISNARSKPCLLLWRMSIVSPPSSSRYSLGVASFPQNA